jgi:hypothetical protein
MEEEFKQTSGLIPFIDSSANTYNNKSPLTLKDVEDFLKMDADRNSKPRILQVGGGFMLSVPDDLFEYYWNMEHLEVLCGIDCHNEIIDRAIKLGCKNIPEKIKK